MNVDLSLVSHTNVGKTSLVRTLLRRDIGEVADRAHVTEAAERHALVETPQGDVLHLWDTPGFGDSARLLRRLRHDGNPLGWFLTQVWDRLVDRPFFCSQQAVRNVRDASDLVLYLVNAAEDPSSAAYVDAELEILRWAGKPVLLLLNQAGRGRDRAAMEADEAQWQARLAAHVPAGRTLTLDAFARCWVQEDRLLRLAGALLAPEKRDAFGRLAAAWRARNLAVFDEAMAVLARQLAQTAVDSEPLAQPGLGSSIAAAARRLVRPGQDAPVDAATQGALDAIARRLRERERVATDRLIAMHGLAGNAKERLASDLAAAVEVSRPLDVAKSGAVGGLVSGALGGLAADLATGGATLALGALVGSILGALGTGGAAHAYNVATSVQGAGMRWSAAMLAERVAVALLVYLAVAHYGRARGHWIDEEAPAHWRQAIESVLASHAEGLEHAWTLARDGATPDQVQDALGGEVTALAQQVLAILYPQEVERLWGVTDARNTE